MVLHENKVKKAEKACTMFQALRYEAQKPSWFFPPPTCFFMHLHRVMQESELLIF